MNLTLQPNGYETLWTLPMELPSGCVPSIPRSITNQPHNELQVGFGSREEHFGIYVPSKYIFWETLEARFLLANLATNPDGEGELVRCWIRIQ